MRFILRSGMCFRTRNAVKDAGSGNPWCWRLTLCRFLVSYVLCSVFFVLGAASCHAEVLERIVAIVNDDVILLSQFEEAFKSAEESGEKKSEGVFLDEMINELLLLKEAKKLSYYISNDGNKAMMNEKDIIHEHINRRIKAFIRIPYDEIESYYEGHKTLFKGKEFYDAKAEIEDYLVRRELDIRLNEYIRDLRKNYYIRVQLKTGD